MESPSADREIWGYWIPAFAGMTRPHTYFALTRSRSRRPATRKTRLVAMPRRWLPVAGGSTPRGGGGGERAARRLDRPCGKPDENGEGEIDLLACGGKERAAGKPRLDRQHKQYVIAVDRKHTDRGRDEEKKREDDHGFRACPIVEHAAEGTRRSSRQPW